MSFSEEAKQEIRRIFHEELQKFVQFQLDGLKPVTIAAPQQQTQPKPTPDNSVCACGKPKKPNFKQCYTCWEKEHAEKAQ